MSAESNVRKKAVSPWMRVWEVFCPDCLKVRSLKSRPNTGLKPLRCHPCGLAKAAKTKTDRKPYPGLYWCPSNRRWVVSQFRQKPGEKTKAVVSRSFREREAAEAFLTSYIASLTKLSSPCPSNHNHYLCDSHHTLADSVPESSGIVARREQPSM